MELDPCTEPNHQIHVEDGSGEDHNHVEEDARSDVQDDEKEKYETLEDYQLTNDRARREIREPHRYMDYLSLVVLSIKT